MNIRKDILWRVYLCFLGMVLVCVFVLAKAIYIQRAQGSFWTEMGDSLHRKYEPIIPERGTIYSEDGNMLSTSVPVFDIYIDFGAEGLREKGGKRFRENLDSLSIALGGLFTDQKAGYFKKILQQGFAEEDRYFLLRRKVSFDDYRQLRNFPLVRLGRNKSGFILTARDKRINPYVLLANRTIGLSRADVSKNVGLELTYDSLLRGIAGQRLMRYAAGSYLPVEGEQLEPVRGKDIVTTLDTYIQDAAETALMKMLVENRSLHGSVIVMETATGKIKAIANLGKQPGTDSTYIEDLNYGIGKTTEPGSIFKLTTLLSLLEDGYADTGTIVNCEGGARKFYGLTIRDSHKGFQDITLKKAFAASSNVAFAKLADQYYTNQPEKYREHLHKMRIDTLMCADIVAKSGKPYVKKPSDKSWHKTTIPYMAHGYESLVAPLTLLTLYNAVANGGKMMRPYLVSAIKDYGVTIKNIQPFVVDPQIASPATISKLQDCMLAVVESNDGTAKKIRDSAYKIAGKTGTAVSANGNKGYNKGNKTYQASFMGYFPADAPKYTMSVVIQNTLESKKVYGADVSGVVFKEVSDKIYARFLSTARYNGKPSKDSLVNVSAGSRKDMMAILGYMAIPYADSATGNWRRVSLAQNTAVLREGSAADAPDRAPDVSGMGLKDAVFLLENKGLKIAVTGRGRVINQSIAAGSPVVKGQKILLYLN